MFMEDLHAERWIPLEDKEKTTKTDLVSSHSGLRPLREPRDSETNL